jgi:hypothetical protein
MTPLEAFLLRAYLDGELECDAAEAFEVLMIERPDIAELVDADTTLRMGLAPAAATADSSTPPPEKYVSPRVAPVNVAQAEGMAGSSRRWRFRFSPALAAGLMLAIGLGSGFLAGRPGNESLQRATLVYIDKTRDISAKASVILPDTGAVVLLAPVASAESCVPEVVLRQAHQADLSARAVKDEFGFVSLVLPRSALRLGEAEVAVSCGSMPTAHYAIRFSATADGVR